MIAKSKPDSQQKRSRKAIVDALDLTVHSTVDMPKVLRQRILDTQPTSAEIAANKWKDAS